MGESKQPVVAITGAAGGIGEALALRFGEAGYRVALADIDPERLAAVAAKLEAGGISTHQQLVDVRHRSELEAWANALDQAWGGVDVVINNAGTMTWGVYVDMSDEEIDLVMDINLRGAMYGCRVFAPRLAARGGGQIVNMASMSSIFASPFQSTYNASKWGLRGFSRSLRMELRRSRVGVSCIMPGTIATDFMKRARSHDDTSIELLTRNMHRFGASPKRVAIKTLRAVRWNFGEQLVGVDAYLVAFVQRFLPGLLPFTLNRLYPLVDPHKGRR